MIVGVGIDVCSIDRMKKALERHGDRFFGRICTAAERADLEGREPATALAGLGSDEATYGRILLGVPTAAWSVSVVTGPWADVARGSARLTRLHVPA